MLKILSMIAAVVLLAFPALARAQGSGLDAYTESPPSANGSETDSGTPETTSGDPGAVSPGAGDAPGAAGAVAGESGSLSEVEAGSQGDGDRAGELPASGLDETGMMAIVGFALLALGLGVHRVAPPAT